ncbi:hypothetical protein H8R17_41795 [Streptomyces sp. TRM68367]|nr:hypothetical protein [Streptomyces sp. TRM68367]
MEPPDPSGDPREEIRRAKTAYDEARKKLFATIKAALAEGIGPSTIARDSGFTREYITKIRDGKGPRDI